MVARLNSDGSNDGGFGEAEHPGRWVGGFGYSLARDVALQPDGKIVIAGDAYSFENLNDPNSTEYRDAWVLRLTAEGQFDLYGTQVDFGTQDRAEALLIQPDGKVVIAGLGWGSDNFDRNDMAFARLHGSNFALDDSFGTGNGKYTVGFGYVDFAFDIVQTSDGGFVAVGRAGDDVGVTKLNSSGTIDLPFAVGGASYEDFGGTDIGFGVDVQPDGKLVFGGGSTDDALTSGDLVAGRLNANGTPDAGFGVGGHSFVDFGALEFASDLVLQPDGRILLLGSTGNETNADFAVARLMGDYVPPPPEPGTPTVDAKTLRATPRGVVPIEITCEGDSNCVGAVVLETARRVAVSRRKRRLRLGSKRFSIPAGQTKVVRVKLRKKGFRLLKRKRKLRTRLTATSTDLSGVKTVTRKTLTLKAPKRAKKWRRR